MKKSGLLGWLANGGWRIGLCAVSLPAVLVGGCMASDDPSHLEDLSDFADEDSQALAAYGPSESSALPGVATYGDIKVSGNKIVDKTGNPVQLRGMSLFWSQWSTGLYNANVVNEVANNWNANLIRAAMGVESGGYLTNPAAEKARVKAVIDAAIAKGIYVIVDWHDHNATQHTNEAKAFFSEIAQTYGAKDNIIFEIFNEPDGEPWSEIKTYANTIIPEIRKYSDNLIVVGTPTWSQDVDQAANSPVAGTNIAYTLHFYAGTHKQSLRDKATYALSKNVALFVTEFGTCDASGNGNLNLAESDTWISFLNTNKISWANWSLFDKDETASALKPNTGASLPYTNLTASGTWVKNKLASYGSGGGSSSSSSSSSGAGGGSSSSSSSSSSSGAGGSGQTGSFSFSVPGSGPNGWWIQVGVTGSNPVTSVVAQVQGGGSYSLTNQGWGWTTSPAQSVGGKTITFKATDSTGAVGTSSAYVWPN